MINANLVDVLLLLISLGILNTKENKHFYTKQKLYIMELNGNYCRLDTIINALNTFRTFAF